MSISPAPSTASRTRIGVLATLLIPVGTALAVSLVMLDATRAPDDVTVDGSVLAFLAWNLLPSVAMAVLLLRSARAGRLELLLALVGSATAAVMTGLALRDFLVSDSSTAALIFIFLPLIQWTVLVLTTAAVLIAHALKSRASAAR